MRSLLVAALLLSSCSMLSGVYGVAERAAPAALGAGTGAVVGGPVGAVVGATAGSAVGQAARGNERTDAQAEAIEDAIRGGRVDITFGMVMAEFGKWLIIGAILLWFFRTPTNLVKDVWGLVKKMRGKEKAPRP